MSKKIHLVAACLALSLAGCKETPTPDPATMTPTPVASSAFSDLPTPDDTLTQTPDSSATPGDPSASATPGDPSASPEVPGAEISHGLKPLPGKESAVPKITKKTTISMNTNAGEVVIEVYPEAAPNAAARFVELVESGFYDDTPISRVVPGFVAQFGVNWRDPHKAFKENNIKDDPSLFSLARGTLAFAKTAAPDSASTQVFINFNDNDHLASMNFTTFGQVVKGMDIVDKFAVVGDPSGGLDQDRLWSDGGAYIESLDAKPTMIEKAKVIK